MIFRCAALRFHDGYEWEETNGSTPRVSGGRFAETLVFVVIPHRATWRTAAMEEPAVGGARRVQVSVATVLPVAVWTVVAIEDASRPGRTG